MDGRYTYCFSNEHWSANSKEVSFNVHGIVYVPESEAPSDPLEKEGTLPSPHYLSISAQLTHDHFPSSPNVRTPYTSKRRARLHRGPRTHAPQYSRIDQRARQVVEHFPARRADRRGRVPGVVAEALFRSKRPRKTVLWQGCAWLTSACAL